MSVFGRITATDQVIAAVAQLLRDWMGSYLRALEDGEGMTAGALYRPHPTNVYGGVDFDSWAANDLPAYIVAAVPHGEPEHAADRVGQWFAVGIGIVVGLPTEEEARRIASYHGAAAMAAIVQHPDLGGIATATRIQQAPAEEFPDPDNRRIVRSEAVYLAFVEPIVEPLKGPRTPLPDDAEAPYPDWPTVQATELTVTPAEEIP